MNWEFKYKRIDADLARQLELAIDRLNSIQPKRYSLSKNLWGKIRCCPQGESFCAIASTEHKPRHMQLIVCLNDGSYLPSELAEERAELFHKIGIKNINDALAFYQASLCSFAVIEKSTFPIHLSDNKVAKDCGITSLDTFTEGLEPGLSLTCPHG